MKKFKLEHSREPILMVDLPDDVLRFYKLNLGVKNPLTSNKLHDKDARYLLWLNSHPDEGSKCWSPVQEWAEGIIPRNVITLSEPFAPWGARTKSKQATEILLLLPRDSDIQKNYYRFQFSMNVVHGNTKDLHHTPGTRRDFVLIYKMLSDGVSPRDIWNLYGL